MKGRMKIKKKKYLNTCKHFELNIGLYLILYSNTIFLIQLVSFRVISEKSGSQFFEKKVRATVLFTIVQ